MRLQLFSDLHLESEDFDPTPAPGAELLVLAGDIDSGWDALARFAHWPVPVLMVAGNHEFDGRDLRHSWADLRAFAASHGIRLIERESVVITSAAGLRVRFVGTVRRELTDRMIFVGTDSFDRALREFAVHYNAERNHQSLDNDLIAPRAPVGCGHGRLERRERLGGLLSFYVRRAA